MAYYAAESGMERTAYKAFKEGCLIGTNCGSGGEQTLYPGGPFYKILEDHVSPNYVSNSWITTVPPGQALQFSLDLNGATYPSHIDISATNNQPSDVVRWLCQTQTQDNFRTCVTSSISQEFYSTIPVNGLNFSPSDFYYKIRITNLGIGTETYRLDFPGSSLSVGLKIDKSEGRYGGYARQLQSSEPDHFARWQIISPKE
jgi:hypothetical protein